MKPTEKYAKVGYFYRVSTTRLVSYYQGSRLGHLKSMVADQNVWLGVFTNFLDDKTPIVVSFGTLLGYI